MTATPDYVIETDALTKKYGEVVAVNELTLRVPRGGVFGFLGPNGSGKTTTMGMLLGLVPGPGRDRATVVLSASMAGDWNKKVIEEFHAKGGVRLTHPFGDRILLLTTTGAKTGKPRTAPLVYHRDGDRYIIAASKGGAPTHPDWYHNLVKHPEAVVEVKTEKFKARATPLRGGPERDRLYAAHADIMPGFRDYETKTKRIIPVIVLERIAS